MRPALAFRRAGLLPLAAGAALAACSQPTQDEAAENAVEEPVLNLPSVPRVDPPLDRAALLAAVSQAASAAAAGADPARLQQLDGRQFELRIRFGCMGPAADLEQAVLGWSFDREEGTLRVRAVPTLSLEDPLVRSIAGERIEAVEGFWIPRPWLLQPVCPAPPRRPAAQARPEPGPEPGGEERQPGRDRQESVAPPSAYPRIGIAQFFTEEDARTRRRDSRPYEAVKTVEADQPAGGQGFDLVISGRLRAFPGRGVIACVAHGPDAPPDCIVSADTDRVRIERPGGEILAEWGSG